jgi:prenyltransferase beta subunit
VWEENESKITSKVNQTSELEFNLNSQNNVGHDSKVNSKITCEQPLIEAVVNEKKAIKKKLTDLQNQWRYNRQLTSTAETTIKELISSIDRITSVESFNLHLLNTLFEVQVMMIQDKNDFEEMKRQITLWISMMVAFVTILMVVITILAWYLMRDKVKPKSNLNNAFLLTRYLSDT